MEGYCQQWNGSRNLAGKGIAFRWVLLYEQSFSPRIRPGEASGSLGLCGWRLSGIFLKMGFDIMEGERQAWIARLSCQAEAA